MHTKSHVEILPTLQNFQKFISLCHSQPTGDRYSLFSLAFQLEKDLIDTLEFYGMVKVSTPVEQLEKQLQTIQHLDFQTLLHTTLQKLMSTYCPTSKITTELFLLDEEDTFGREKLGGVSAFAGFDGTLTFIVYPEEKVRTVLESVITHEFHHFWRMGILDTTEENETLLDCLVLEGQAEYFVGKLLGKDRQGPFNKALTEEQARELWDKVYCKQLNLKGELANPLMFGGDNGLPLWAGYSMGYHLVQWYTLRHPELTIEELTALPSEAFIYETERG